MWKKKQKILTDMISSKWTNLLYFLNIWLKCICSYNLFYFSTKILLCGKSSLLISIPYLISYYYLHCCHVCRCLLQEGCCSTECCLKQETTTISKHSPSILKQESMNVVTKDTGQSTWDRNKWYPSYPRWWKTI